MLLLDYRGKGIMENKITKITLLCFSLMCSPAFAASSSGNSLNNENTNAATAPSAQKKTYHFYAGIMGLYYMPSDGSTGYAQQNGKLQQVDSNLHLLSGAEIGYFLTNDTQIGFYDHGFNIAYKDTDSSSGTLKTPFNDNEYGKADASTTLKPHVLGIQLRKNVRNGKFEITYEFGAEYAHFDQSMNATYSQPKSAPLVPTTIDSSSTYEGAGPKLGGVVNYHLFKNIGLYGEASLVALAGHVKTSLEQTGSANYKFSKPNTHRIVYHYDIAAGLRYSFHLSSSVSTSLDIGYRTETFTNAIDKVVKVNNGNPTYESSNLEFNGPFLSIHFAV